MTITVLQRLPVNQLKRVELHVIYDHPRDYPAYFVTRIWDLAPGAERPVPRVEARLASTLDEARRQLPPGLSRLDRHPNDDAKICEIWL